MKKKFIFLGIAFLSLFGAHTKAQTIDEAKAKTKTGKKVGVNTNVPTRALTVQNSADNDGKPPLRLVNTPQYDQNINSAMDADLGGNTQAKTKYTDYRPLVINSVGDVYQGAPITSTLSVITLKVSNVDQDWISTFDTGIDYNKYAVAMMNYTLVTPDDKTALVANRGAIPNYSYGTQNTSLHSARVAPPNVKLKKSGSNWAVEADYPSMSLTRTDPSVPTDIGTAVNGTWVFTLLVGKRDLVNFVELNFDQGGRSSGSGNSNATYKQALEQLLKTLN